MASVAGSPRAWDSDGDRDPEDEASAIGQCMASVPIEGFIRGAWLLGFDRKLVASLGAKRQIDERLTAANGWRGGTDILEKWGIIIEWDDAEGLSRSNGDVHIWLVEKLFNFLKQPRVGWYGQEFQRAGPERCMACFAWTDDHAKSGQLTPYDASTKNSWMTWRPCIVAVRALPYDEYGMPFYYLELKQNNSKPRGCHASYIAPRKSALPLRMVEVENPDEFLYETFSACQRLGPPLSLAGPAPPAILTLPPLRSGNSNDEGASAC